MPTDVLPRTPIRLRSGPAHLDEDRAHFRLGILDAGSFRSGWRPVYDPVEVTTTSLINDGVAVDPQRIASDPRLFTDPWVTPDGFVLDKAWGNRRRVLREIRRQHNQQLNVGANQLQRILQFGDLGSSALAGCAVTGSGTAPTATTWTAATGAALPTATSSAGNSGLQGHVLFVVNTLASSAFTNPVFGVIMSNTATVITVDQWYACTTSTASGLAGAITGAAGTTPSANSAAFILPMAAWAAWIALSTDSTAPAAADVTRTADGLWGNGTSGGAATEQTANGLARAYCGYGNTGTAPSLPATRQYQLAHTWTYSTTGSVTIQKVILFNSLAAAGTIPVLDTLLNASATVSASGDTCAATWTISL